ncbi:dGTP triphosphohydrolase [Roseibium algae]|uniref:DNTP triphosphohydrolase n=1 Tax=Roseibium algae TaxID=3123038 RepID=A0ABU8TLE1_9HYPH
MDWAKLLDGRRLQDTRYEERPNRPSYLQDADRITFSAPFRRLANKTQVHPLYENDHIHHRLIHSLETSSVGRSLGIEIGDWLEENKKVEAGDRHRIAGIVGAACLAHDIGNPPFGHSGEAAIGQWFEDRFSEGRALFAELEPSLQAEFNEFEGNAQGFRIITRLEMRRNKGGMRLSRGVLGAFTKYPVTASVKNRLESNYCGLKKFGIFESDMPQFEEVASAVGLPQVIHEKGTSWRRHPLVFLVEAADDICYNILDMEDAHTSGDFSFDAVFKLLAPLAELDMDYVKDMLPEEAIALARALGIGNAIIACVEAFKENYAAIMDGTFSGALIDVSSKAGEFQEIKILSKERLFTSPRKTELEVQGRNVVHKVLDGVSEIYEQLQANGWQVTNLSSYHRQLIKAAGVDIRDVDSPYTALHSLADFTSGMTDRYAVKVARMLSGG